MRIYALQFYPYPIAKITKKKILSSKSIDITRIS